MNKGIFFIGIDVDDKSFHGCGINRETGEIREFKCKPAVGYLAKELEKFKEGGEELRTCYEATYLGFTLHRDLVRRGYQCDVIAPSLIPRKHGKAVKNDRIDSYEMASYYMNGQLTKVHVPSVEEEMVRDMVRSRRFMSEQQASLKLHILSSCRRIGLDYRGDLEGKRVNYWTKSHRSWLSRQLKEVKYREHEFNMRMLLQQLEESEARIRVYDERLAQEAQRPTYREKVKALRCYRGIELITAMTLITELHDIRRFSHPKQLCSYAGMDLREYSSGGHERRYRMSKMGNRHIRTSVIEACQQAKRIPHVGKTLRSRRAGVNERYIKIADRCMERLYKKSQRLLGRDKMANKVKVACAREMLCFVWESLRAATA